MTMRAPGPVLALVSLYLYVALHPYEMVREVRRRPLLGGFSPAVSAAPSPVLITRANASVR